MLKFIKSFFGKKEVTQEATQTYESLKPAKVETTIADQAIEAVVTSIAPAKKAPAKKPAAKKAVAKKAPAVKKPKAVK